MMGPGQPWEALHGAELEAVLVEERRAVLAEERRVKEGGTRGSARAKQLQQQQQKIREQRQAALAAPAALAKERRPQADAWSLDIWDLAALPQVPDSWNDKPMGNPWHHNDPWAQEERRLQALLAEERLAEERRA